MFHRELDYRIELKSVAEFRRLLASDDRYVVPEPIEAYSTRRVLALQFEDGWPVDSAQVMQLPQERRNFLAMAALELYLREIFVFGKVQTDPHFGNYRCSVCGT